MIDPPPQSQQPSTDLTGPGCVVQRLRPPTVDSLHGHPFSQEKPVCARRHVVRRPSNHRPHLRRTSAHICAATRPTSAPRLGPHLRRDSAHSSLDRCCENIKRNASNSVEMITSMVRIGVISVPMGWPPPAGAAAQAAHKMQHAHVPCNIQHTKCNMHTSGLRCRRSRHSSATRRVLTGCVFGCRARRRRRASMRMRSCLRRTRTS